MTQITLRLTDAFNRTSSVYATAVLERTVERSPIFLAVAQLADYLGAFFFLGFVRTVTGPFTMT